MESGLPPRFFEQYSGALCYARQVYFRADRLPPGLLLDDSFPSALAPE